MKIPTIPILYQCPHYLIINKPPFTYSQAPDRHTQRRPDPGNGNGTGNHEYPEILLLLETAYPHLFAPQTTPFTKPKLVHRLDYEVSGAMLLATSLQAARWFSRGLKYSGSEKGGKVKKSYIGLLELPNTPRYEAKKVGREGKEINRWSSRTEQSMTDFLAAKALDKTRGLHLDSESENKFLAGYVNLDVAAKQALTRFWLSSRPGSQGQQQPAPSNSNITPTDSMPKNKSSSQSKSNYLLGMFEPVTGRKHQIRQHCALGLGMPIVGDIKYGAVPSLANQARKQNNSAHQAIALHSAMIQVEFGRSKVMVKAPVWDKELWRGYVGEDGLLAPEWYEITNEKS